MRDAAKVFDEDGVDAQHCVLIALGLEHVAYGQRAHVAAVLEIARVERLQPHLVKDLTAPGPGREHARGIGCRGAADVLVLLYSLVPRMIPFCATSCTTCSTTGSG